MQRTKYASSLTMSWEQFERHTGYANLDVQKCLTFAQHIADHTKEKFKKRGWICINEARTDFGFPPVIDYCSKIYLRAFGNEPVEVELAPNGIGIVITMRNYIDLCDGPIK